MGLKKVENIQKYSGKRKTPDEKNNINSKENVEKIEDAKDEINEIPPIMQIDYDELPDGVYDFAGLSELQNRRTRPNLRENEKLLKSKNKKEKKQKERKQKKRSRLVPIEDKGLQEHKNIVEEIFEAKKNGEENNIQNNFIIEELDIREKEQEKNEIEVITQNEDIPSEFKTEEQVIEPKIEAPVLEENIQEEKSTDFSKLDNEVKEQDKLMFLNKEENKDFEYQPKVEILESKTEIIEEKKLEIDNSEILEENQINIPEVTVKKLEKTNRSLEPKRRKSKVKNSHVDLIEDEDIEEDFSEKVVSFFTSSKKFAFIIMFFLGVITQISFLATNRENNILGIEAITLFAISMFLLVNVLEIKNKILIFIMSLIVVCVPEYTNTFITGENSILYSLSILLSLFSLNLVFLKKNRIIGFVIAVTMFSIGYKIFQDCMNAFLVIGIIKIIEEIFNRKERILNFLIHCLMICAILSVVIFL